MIGNKFLQTTIHHFRTHVSNSRGGGVTTIYAGTGCATFGMSFFEQKINFGVSFLVKSQVVINFGVSF